MNYTVTDTNRMAPAGGAALLQFLQLPRIQRCGFSLPATSLPQETCKVCRFLKSTHTNSCRAVGEGTQVVLCPFENVRVAYIMAWSKSLVRTEAQAMGLLAQGLELYDAMYDAMTITRLLSL